MVKYSEGLKNKPLYKEFGKYIINIRDLLNNVLFIRYKSYADSKMKRRNVSDKLKQLLFYIFDTSELNYNMIKELENEEYEFFNTIMNKSGLTINYNYDKKKGRENKEDIIEEFNVLKGEIMASNDNPEIIKKARDCVKKLFRHKLIDEDEYLELLEDLK